ncbi:MAG: radical SAM protein with 4Fe4S-binding SPASM domain [Flavobacteriales bacterium]|jgi:radical SAM protein with 4Fe4S-binding SPASM domain
MNWQTTDILQQIKALTVYKCVNALKLVSSYYLSRWVKKPLHWGLPFSISVEPTTACNLGCPECPSGLKKFSRATGKMAPSTLKKLLHETGKSLGNMIFYFQGEPYLHPEFTELVKVASDKGIYTTTSTNAHFLTPKAARKTIESGLSRLIISVDGTTQEVYESYRIHGKLEKVIEGTKNILAMKKEMGSKTPHVIFQFLVVRPNEHQIDDVHKLAKELGVNEVRLKTAQVYEYENGNELIPNDQAYSRYTQMENGKWRLKNKLLNQCWRMWQGCVITWDGNVVPCCFDKDATYNLGSTSEQTFTSIWRDKSYQNFRGSVLKSRSEIDICKNCTEGTKVWAS